MEVDKNIKKDIEGSKIISKDDKKKSRYVAERNVKKLLKQGWSIVNKNKETSDLILMEK